MFILIYMCIYTYGECNDKDWIHSIRGRRFAAPNLLKSEWIEGEGYLCFFVFVPQGGNRFLPNLIPATHTHKYNKKTLKFL